MEKFRRHLASSAQLRSRGRPRDDRIDTRVASVVLEILRRGGYRRVTIQGVARRVGCARTSLYRRWPSRRHLVAFAVVRTLGAEPAPDSGSLRIDLVSAIDTLRRGFSGPLAAALPGLVGELAHDAQLARLIRKEVLMRRRASIARALERGAERGEIARGRDLDALIDILTAPCYFRVLFGMGAITRRYIETLVDYSLRAVRA
jgi:AcrR family transcriptional regulator